MAPNTADVRRFLTDYFNDHEITTLCFDYFRAVYDGFASGMSKGQKIQALIEYSSHREQFPELLNILQEERPTQFPSRLGQMASNVAVSATSSSTADAAAMSGTNISGGVNVNANNVDVGNDVVGRDKIIQAGTYIEHATIIHSGTTIPEIKPTGQTASPAIDASQTSDSILLQGKIWLSDPNNHRVIGGVEFVRVPAGKFIMGSTNSDKEKPQHTVEIPYDYWICKYPVTNEQYAEFVAAAHYQFNQGNWKPRAAHPVVNISWRDALAYCQWLNQRWQSELKGLTLRLPTEAEWEKAARGTDGRIYPWGNDFDKSKCNTSEGYKGSTTSVGVYSPQGDSPYGAGDMAGNVWEWCHSLYKPYPYQVDDGRENEMDDGARMLRGGSWVGDQVSARCAFRNDNSPANRYDLYGFRYLLNPKL